MVQIPQGEEKKQRLQKVERSKDSFDANAVWPNRPDKSGRAWISGHLEKIARITPGFLWFGLEFCDKVHNCPDFWKIERAMFWNWLREESTYIHWKLAPSWQFLSKGAFRWIVHVQCACCEVVYLYVWSTILWRILRLPKMFPTYRLICRKHHPKDRALRGFLGVFNCLFQYGTSTPGHWLLCVTCNLLQTQDFSSSDISTFRNLNFPRNTGSHNIRYIFFPKPCWSNVACGFRDFFLQIPLTKLFITKNEESQRLWNFIKKWPP